MRIPFRSLVTAIAVASCSGNAPRTTASAPPPVPSGASSTPAPLPPSPEGPRREIVEEDLFGIHLVDPYRWMEKHENAAEVTQWMIREGKRTRARLDAMPGHAKLRDRSRDLGMSQAFATIVKQSGDLLFYFKTEKGADLRKLVVRSRDGRERVLVDPVSIPAPNGQHVSINHFEPSDDGKWVAYGLAEGGSEITSEHVVETKTARVLPDVLSRVFGMLPVHWRADGSGLYYTQMISEEEAKTSDPLQNQRLLFHRLGDAPQKDTVVLGKGVEDAPHFEPREFPMLASNPGSRWVVGLGGGARPERRIFAARANDLRAPTVKSAWTTVAEYTNNVMLVGPYGDERAVVHGDELYLLTASGAPNRRIVRVSLNHPKLADAAVAVAESADVIEELAADASSLYIHKNRNGRSRLQRLPFRGGAIEDVELPFDGWIDALTTDPRREGLIVHLQGWTSEDRYFVLRSKSRSFEELPLAEPSGIDVSSLIAEEVEVPSTGGVSVPLTIIHRKDLGKDGTHPTILDGYGGYGISATPSFRPYRFAWIERGGVYAIAHVRGGGEKGDSWRLDGKGPNKPHGIQDFIACAEYLVREKYTSTSRLAASGGSGGGILIGRAVTERPDLFAAASIYAGVVNAMRILEASNGANQKDEMGSPDNEAGAHALYAMDVFYNVRAGVKYPPLMLGAGLNDERVSPWMTAKLGAQILANGGQVWLRVEGDDGHGFASTRRQRFDLFADAWSFFLQQMGDPAFK